MKDKDKNDEELVLEYISGNLAAFDAIVKRIQNQIFRLCCLWLKNDQDDEDATQEIFIGAFKGLCRFHFGTASFTWLFS